MKKLLIKIKNQYLLDTSQGICHANQTLYNNKLISKKEYEVFRNYLDEHLIKGKTEFFNTRNQKTKYPRYVWKKGEIEPRLRWLDQRIKTLKQ